mmetsp:Transcript_46303/g.72502  ORF Transcript_46303/g.72502 Transcript_46303/m.72502 type:complete len:88 (-) Transcript_46303:661-924(-)
MTAPQDRWRQAQNFNIHYLNQGDKTLSLSSLMTYGQPNHTNPFYARSSACPSPQCSENAIHASLAAPVMMRHRSRSALLGLQGRTPS